MARFAPFPPPPAAAAAGWWPPTVDEVSLRLLRRPALQGLGGAIFMNGFSQGAFPVTLVLFAVEHMQMSSTNWPQSATWS